MRRADRPPVLLVPGWSDTARVLRRCRDHLVDHGWLETQVRAMSFRDRYGSNVEHAAELDGAARTLARSTAAARIAVVAHSMGGLALRRFLLDGGDALVDTAIFVGTPHRGTWLAWLAWGRGGAEMRPGSEFLEHLNATPMPTSVRTVCLRTPIDTRIVPGTSAFLADADCRTVRLPTHPGMLRHAPTLGLIRDLLLDGRARAA